MVKKALAVLLTVSIPVMLFVTVWQSSRYVSSEREMNSLDKKQYEIVAINRRYISGISVLTSPDRIERVAIEDLGMRKARPEEIIRISLNREGRGG